MAASVRTLAAPLASLDVLWVNHPNRTADSVYKPLQLATAARCGLTTVPTVITNSPDAIRRLAAESPTGVVRKSLGHNTVTEGGQLTVAYTHRLTAEDLADLADADATATQAQQWVNKTRAGKTVGGGVGQEQRGLRGTLRRWGQDGAMSDAAPSPNPAVCQLRVVLAGAL